MIRLAPEDIDAAAEIAAFASRCNRAGAIASFQGIVRPEQDVTALFIDHHPALTLEAMRTAAAEAQARWPLDDLLVVHRVGEIAAGRTIVVVATASAHRRAAFNACDFLMDYLKTDAPFWKKERRKGGGAWIEPRGADYEDRARWNEEG